MGNRSTLGRLSARCAAVIAAVTLSAGLMTACSSPAESGSQNTEPLPTATVPAPGGGSIDETVAPVAQGEMTEAELGSTVDLEDGVSVTVTDVTELDVEANTPGEIAGPAVAVTVELRNDSGDPIDMSTAMVSVVGSAGAYGQATTSAPSGPIDGVVQSGATASGVYVFRLPAEERASLQVTVEYIAGAPIAVFAGAAR